MKKDKVIIFFTLYLSIFFGSCENKPKDYDLYFQDNNLCIVIFKQPTIGISGFNELDWINLNELTKSVFSKLQKSNLQDTCNLYCRFYKPTHDKYGNKIEKYDDIYLLSLPINEIKKYKDWKYFEKNYNLINLIKEAKGIPIK